MSLLQKRRCVALCAILAWFWCASCIPSMGARAQEQEGGDEVGPQYAFVLINAMKSINEIMSFFEWNTGAKMQDILAVTNQGTGVQQWTVALAFERHRVVTDIYAFCMFHGKHFVPDAPDGCLKSMLNAHCKEAGDLCGMQCCLPEEWACLQGGGTPCTFENGLVKRVAAMNEFLCRQDAITKSLECGNGVYACPYCFEGNTGYFPSVSQGLSKLARKVHDQHLLGHVQTKPVICEIGFNAGHSALAYLHSVPDATIISFDLGAHQYVPYAFAWLRSTFPAATLELLIGDSTLSVPTFARLHPELKCNILFVDGGHSYQIAAADIENMKLIASPDFHVLLVDDANIPTVRQAWSESLTRGTVQDLPAHMQDWNIPGILKPGADPALYMVEIKAYVDQPRLDVYMRESDNMFAGVYPLPRQCEEDGTYCAADM